MPFAAKPVGPQFRPEELFDLLGALGFARYRQKSRVASCGPRFGCDPRQNRANRRAMLLSHDVAGGDMRVVDPYHLTSAAGDWYLAAYCHLREEVRLFVPGRIRSAVTTGRPSQTSGMGSLGISGTL